MDKYINKKFVWLINELTKSDEIKPYVLPDEDLLDKDFSCGICTEYMNIFIGAWEKDNYYYYHVKIVPLSKIGSIRIDGKTSLKDKDKDKTLDDFFSYCLKMCKEEMKFSKKACNILCTGI